MDGADSCAVTWAARATRSSPPLGLCSELVSMEVALALARRAVGSRLQRFLAPGLETVFIDQLLHWTHIVLLCAGREACPPRSAV